MLFVLNSKSSTTSQSINQNVTIDLLSSDDDEITEQKNAHNSQDNENKQIQLINSSASNDASILPDILFDCVYPDFYENTINSDKSGEIIEAEFLKAEWMTNELVEELFHFVPPSPQDGQSQESIDHTLKVTFEKYCAHIFPLKREFANYRQLEQYLNLFLKSWKIRKNRDGYSFKCFYAMPNQNYAIKNEYLPQKQRSIKILKKQIKCPFILVLVSKINRSHIFFVKCT